MGYYGSAGFTGSAGPSNIINATSATTGSMYLVMVPVTGSNQTAYADPGLYYDTNANTLYVSGEVVANKLTIELTTVTTTLVTTDDIIKTTNTTPTTSTSSGALQITGGAGIGGGLFVGDIITVAGSTNATSTTTGALKVSGGVSVVKDVYIGGTLGVGVNNTSTDATVTIAPMGYAVAASTDTLLHLAGDTTKRRLLLDSTSPNGPVILGRQANGTQLAPTATSATNVLLFIDAAGYNGTAYNAFSAAMTMNAAEDFTATAAGSYISLSTTPLQTVGTVERVRIDSTGSVYIKTTAAATSTTNGALVVSGGAGIAGDLYVGGTINGSVASASTASNITVSNDYSTTPQYITFVSTSSGSTNIKTSATVGLTFVPSSGYVGIGVTTATDTDSLGGRVVDIKGPVYIRQSNNSITYMSIGAYNGTTYMRANGASNQLAISTAGSEALRITATGNVGIGTTAPNTTHNAGAPHLVVKGTGDLIIAQATTVTNGEVVLGPDYIYQNKNQSLRFGTNNSQVGVFTNGGYFGINKTDPQTRLHVVGSHVSGRGTIEIDGTDFGLISIRTPANGDGTNGYWGVRSQDDTGADLMFYGHRKVVGSYEGFIVDHTFAGYADLFVNKTDGFVGLSNTTPGERLTVSGNVLAYGSTGAVGSGTAYYLGNGAASRDISFTRAGNATLAIGRYTTAWFESLRINSSGNLSVGNSGDPASGAQIDFSKNVMYVGPNGGPGVIGVWEAESLSRTGGTVNTDASASGGQNWGTNGNLQIYGPYTNLPRGNYRLVARIKVADATYTGNAARVTLTLGGTGTFKDRYLKGTDFRANNVWETVSVPFTIDAVTAGQIEFYVFGQNSQQIYVDYVMVVNDNDSYSHQIWGNFGIGTNPAYKFHLSNSGNTTQAFYVDAGNSASTQVLFEHTGANTPVPFSIRKSGYSGASQDYGVLHLDMAHNVAGGGANLHFTLRDSASNLQEYGGIGAYIVTNTDGAENGNLALYTTAGGTARQQRVTVRYDGNVGVATTNPSYKLEVNGSFAATTKSFVIDHPTKAGMRLRYGSLEGPENGVYVRGRLTGSNTIELPEYWTKLVDADSITVNITPVGKHQKLFVKEIADNKVVIGNDAMFTNKVDCFYVVYGERCDVEKLETEVWK